MKEIIEKINALPYRVKPVGYRNLQMPRSCGLVGDYRENIYPEETEAIRREIWSSGLKLRDKEYLNELLCSHYPI
jgi:hypothetical protein